MKFFVTGVNGQLGHDVMNELYKRGHEGIGSDIAEAYAVVATCRDFRLSGDGQGSGVFLVTASAGIKGGL